MKRKDLNMRKIWIGNNPELLQKVVDALANFNLTISTTALCKIEDNPCCLWISESHTFGTYTQTFTRAEFEKKTIYKELLPSELLGLETYQIY